MQPDSSRLTDHAEVVLSSKVLDDDVEFFRGLGFKVDSVFPADDPLRIGLVGHGLRLRLERGDRHPPAALRLPCEALPRGPSKLVAPNGTLVELVDVSFTECLPTLRSSLVVTHASEESRWIKGRAGMQYRDLAPGHVGGHFIVSHIRIPDGGEVPDYVHYHHVRFQTIYCLRGWVKVVYEDQGEPFVLQPGDCVLQPSEIRHRVLECSPGLEVLEIGSPARHETRADHELELPNPVVNPEREFKGQVFLRHQAQLATWSNWRLSGFEARDSGMELATRGLARLHVARPNGEPLAGVDHQLDAFRFWYLTSGRLRVRLDGNGTHDLRRDDAIVLPEGAKLEVEDCAPDTELIEIALPA